MLWDVSEVVIDTDGPDFTSLSKTHEKIDPVQHWGEDVSYQSYSMAARDMGELRFL